jgi:hypothetical protein
MAGTTKGYSISEIQQGPGDLWIIGTAPNDAAVRLTLASDGTPDSTAHPGSYHLGGVMSAINTTVKPKITEIGLDQYDAPVDAFLAELDAKVEAPMAQLESQKLQWALGVGTYATGSGYKQVTWGGTLIVPKVCLAVISPSTVSAGNFVVALMYVAVPAGGFSFTMGRAKQAEYKAQFQGLSDVARTAGKQIGVIYTTLTAPVGGTPTAKNTAVAEIYEGAADLWLISPAPVDATARVTLDATTLTPDSTQHAGAVGLGMTTGPVTFSVTPKLDLVKMDQFDGPVDARLNSISAKIEAEMGQMSMDKLARALGVGNYTLSGGSYAQCTFGGTNQPPAICVAAIGAKRSDTTKAAVACLYRVNAAEGITWSASRTKASTYKVSFTGQADITRTAGKQVGIFHEMI